MHLYEYEDTAEETEHSFVLQVYKTTDDKTRWWSCYGNTSESSVMDRYYKTKNSDPHGTYRVIKVIKHITRHWETLEIPEQQTTKYKLSKKPNGYDFGALYIVEDENGNTVFTMTSEKLWDFFLLLPTKEKVIELLLGRGTNLTKAEQGALKFLINKTYSEFMNKNI